MPTKELSREGAKEPKELGGVSREMVMVAAGFFMGLAERQGFDQHERNIIRAGSKALKAAGENLWPSPASRLRGK
jgi:hypothetical protein